MPRSVKVRSEFISQVKSSLPRNGYIRQTDLAEYLQISQSTISSFLNGRPVDYLNFREICLALGLEWQDIADLTVETGTSSVAPILNKISSFPSLEHPSGQVPLDSPFYIKRTPIEERCYEQIHQPGALIRIKAPRQMGKTSLLTRIINKSASQGDSTVTLDFQLAAQQIFVNSDKFLRWFCASVGLALNIPNKIDEYWDLASIVGSSMACKAYFEEYLLPTINKPLTLGLDEVDKVFEYPEIYRDFFGLLRALHEEGKRREIWKKLRLVIVHSTEVYVPLDINQSPFNVGLAIELPEFNSKQILDLAQRHQLNWNDTEVDKLMTLVGGHPFLIRLAFYHIASGNVSLTKILENATSPKSIFAEHLRRQSLILTQQPELAEAMKDIVNNSNPALSIVTKFKLQSIGLIKLQGDNVFPRCNLYRQYLRIHV
ncbi:AAA-like domain-containing protein [Plectonema cf. radiosum LEGE 06105]|uniref:AAA-like domain-containing protein n=1 Tax=Plectonema cf. radiosum LEGE 06105 TaxID=945769 RepID=A0A8J7K0K9_9CYAN|nr:AAA-like domain-containing protein [Plectonema radiosum]MBE9213781.1 AAA-like domain-containing protein [Plectonema cf. radiosum LEGE 06105]